uniref:Uncharacterized protein n=1 Tax=Phytophthora fragariae TaxID=53985 RepID=A0A6A3F0F9_9STRA|nr:hypothetical protein PF009_g12333 [Phytophthora fragariae]
MGVAPSDAAVRAVNVPVRGQPAHLPAALSMQKFMATPLSAQLKFSFVMTPRFCRQCVTTLELADNCWTHAMDISGYAVRDVDSGRVLFTPSRYPTVELHELQFAPTGQDGDPQQARANVKVHHVTGAFCPPSTARRQTAAPSGSWTSTASRGPLDAQRRHQRRRRVSVKRHQPTINVLTMLRIKFVKPGRGESLLAQVGDPHKGGKRGVGCRGMWR